VPRRLVECELEESCLLCTAVAVGMFKLSDTGSDKMKVLAVAHALALFLRLDSGRSSRTDTIRVSKVRALIAIALVVLASA
jgi:hypothetical protein